MGFHDSHGIPVGFWKPRNPGNLGNPMGIPRKSHGNLGNPMKILGIPWESENPGNPESAFSPLVVGVRCCCSLIGRDGLFSVV